MVANLHGSKLSLHGVYDSQKSQTANAGTELISA